MIGWLDHVHRRRVNLLARLKSGKLNAETAAGYSLSAVVDGRIRLQDPGLACLQSRVVGVPTVVAKQGAVVAEAVSRVGFGQAYSHSASAGGLKYRCCMSSNDIWRLRALRDTTKMIT